MEIRQPKMGPVITGLEGLRSYFDIGTGVLIGSEAHVETGYYEEVPVEDAVGGFTRLWHRIKHEVRPTTREDFAKLLDHGVDVLTDLHAKTEHNRALLPENDAMIAQLAELEPLYAAACANDVAATERIEALSEQVVRLERRAAVAESQLRAQNVRPDIVVEAEPVDAEPVDLGSVDQEPVDPA